MNFVKGVSNLLTALDNFLNFTYFSAIDLIQTDGIAVLEAPEFQMSPLTGLDQYGPRGCQPLHYAIQSKSQAAINWILSLSPPINAQTETEGWNGAHCAVLEENPETFAKLIEMGVDLNVLDWKEMTPLAYVKNDFEFDKWSDEMTKKLSLNFKIPLGPHKRTYLHFFASDSTLKLLNYVAKAYPLAINIPDKTGTTPLMLAAESGQLEATSVLLLKEAKYDLVDELGRMAIHRAAAAGQTDSCKLLLFDPDLIQTTDGVDEEFFTEIEGETIDRLKSRALLGIQDYNGMTPLMLAALNCHVETVRVLSSYREHLNLAHPQTGDTALHYAVQAKSPEIVSILLESFADPDPKNAAGLKPIDLVSSNNADDPVEHDIFLLLAGSF